MVYAREVEGQELNLQVSGMLWNRSLVMRDLETGSLWSHILGRCMDGDLKDQELPFVPGTVTTFQDWLSKHPDSSVLLMPRTALKYQRYAYTEPRDYVIGIKVGTTVKAYTYAYLAAHPIVQETLNKTPILLAFDPASTRAFVFERKVGDEPVEFKPEYSSGNLIDVATESEWDPWSGKSTSGARSGVGLPTLYGIISYRRAWEIFYPDTEVVDLPAAAPVEESETGPLEE